MDVIRKRERIRKRSEFIQIFKNGKRIDTCNFRIYIGKNELRISRFAVVTGKKLGNAVVRNRIKRLVKEVFRRNKAYFGNEIDWIFIPKGSWEDIGYFHTKRIIMDAICGIKMDKRFFTR